MRGGFVLRHGHGRSRGGFTSQQYLNVVSEYPGLRVTLQFRYLDLLKLWYFRVFFLLQLYFGILHV